MNLALLVLFLLKLVLADEDELSLPFELPIFGLEQGIRCGKEYPGVICLNGMCCSVQGWCGNATEYCSPGHCQSQCCGWQADGRLCSTGVCCSNDGRCGTTQEYCAPGHCQSQCWCGRQANGTSCSTGECCSNDGRCGTTQEYCAPGHCQSQCWCGRQANGTSCSTGECCSNNGWCGTISCTSGESHSSLSPLLVGLFIFLIGVALVFYRRFANSPLFSTLS